MIASMRLYLSIFLMFSFVIFGVHSVQARMDGIAAVVNDGVVSVSDVQDRVKLVMISSGLPNTPEVREKVLDQVLNGLIEEKIKSQEAERLNLTVTADDVTAGFTTIAAQNKMEPEEFRNMLQKGGISIATLEQQIRAQIAWTKVVQAEIRPNVTVSAADIEEEQNRLLQNSGAREYLIAQIALPVEQASAEEETRKLADRLLDEIKTGKAPFFRVAQQFSKAPGASQGGDLGWIAAGQLPPELDRVLAQMDKGSVSAPIRTSEGYHLLLVRDIREMTPETLPSEDDIRSALGLKRLEQRQRRYYMDLKAAAFVEKRLSDG